MAQSSTHQTVQSGGALYSIPIESAPAPAYVAIATVAALVLAVIVIGTRK
jgi:hypothetical protein